jgi:hypothetical protein
MYREVTQTSQAGASTLPLSSFLFPLYLYRHHTNGQTCHMQGRRAVCPGPPLQLQHTSLFALHTAYSIQYVPTVTRPVYHPRQPRRPMPRVSPPAQSAELGARSLGRRSVVSALGTPPATGDHSLQPSLLVCHRHCAGAGTWWVGVAIIDQVRLGCCCCCMVWHNSSWQSAVMPHSDSTL